MNVDSSKVWLYSSDSNGKLQGRWCLNSEEITALREQICPTGYNLDALETAASSCITALKQQHNDDTAQRQARLALCHYLSQHDAIESIDPREWRNGTQLIVADYVAPDGSLIFTVFTLPQNKPLNNAQLEIVVCNVLGASGGSCSIL